MIHSTMPLDQSLGFLATMLTEAAATRPWAMADSRPPRAMGRQEARMMRRCRMGSSATVPSNRPIFSRAKNPMTRPYRPWVPGMTCRIMHLENWEGSSDRRPAAASPAMPVPLAEPTQARPAARAAPRNPKKGPAYMVRNSLIYILFFLLNIDVLGVDFQRTPGTSAFLIKLFEKFQILQSGRVYIGTNDIEPDVEAMSQQEDDEENWDPQRRGQPAAGHGRQDVEHLADDRAGQHHHHQAGVGEDVSKIAGDTV